MAEGGDAENQEEVNKDESVRKGEKNIPRKAGRHLFDVFSSIAYHFIFEVRSLSEPGAHGIGYSGCLESP
jgi:hypothetical protein